METNDKITSLGEPVLYKPEKELFEGYKDPLADAQKEILKYCKENNVVIPYIPSDIELFEKYGYVSSTLQSFIDAEGME